MSSSIHVRGLRAELKARLKSSASRNFRSLNQEVLARLEASFALEDALRLTAHQAWIDQALAGGFHPGSVQRLRQIAARAKTAK